MEDGHLCRLFLFAQKLLYNRSVKTKLLYITGGQTSVIQMVRDVNLGVI